MSLVDIILFNVIVTLLCIWVIMAINTRYLQPALINRTRFRLYELRDRLALLAMRGELEEDSLEYITLMRFLNCTIYGTSTFRVVDFFKSLVQLKRNKKLQEELDQTVANIDSVNPEYRQIASEFFGVVHILYAKQTRLVKYFILPALMGVVMVIGGLTILSSFKDMVLGKKKLMEEIDHDLTYNGSRFAAQ